MDKLTLTQAKQLDDNDIEIYLKKSWNIEDNDLIEVTGAVKRISFNNNYNVFRYVIYNIKFKNGQKVEYPIKDLGEKEKLENNRIYIPANFLNLKIQKLLRSNKQFLISCILTLAKLKRRNNPFLLEVNPAILNQIEKARF